MLEKSEQRTFLLFLGQRRGLTTVLWSGNYKIGSKVRLRHRCHNYSERTLVSFSGTPHTTRDCQGEVQVEDAGEGLRKFIRGVPFGLWKYCQMELNNTL